jgi:hypothetical protein
MIDAKQRIPRFERMVKEAERAAHPQLASLLLFLPPTSLAKSFEFFAVNWLNFTCDGGGKKCLCNTVKSSESHFKRCCGLLGRQSCPKSLSCVDLTKLPPAAHVLRQSKLAGVQISLNPGRYGWKADLGSPE